MRIFKENSYDILRLYINQLGIMIFSMMLYTAVGSIENDALSYGLSITVSVFSVCFYLVLIYYIMWEIGAKDKIKIDGGRMEPCKHKGIVMGLFANVPNFVLGALSVIFLAVFMTTGNEAIGSAFFLFCLLMRFNGSMYLSLICALAHGSAIVHGEDIPVDYGIFLTEGILFIVVPLISVAVTHFAYYLGTKDKKLFSVFKK